MPTTRILELILEMMVTTFVQYCLCTYDVNIAFLHKLRSNVFFAYFHSLEKETTRPFMFFHPHI